MIGQAGRRVVVEALGETPLEAVAQHVRVVDQPAPDADSLGPGDAVVAVKAAAVNWVDLLMTSGQYQQLVQPPYTPGLEYAGVVAWVGRDVTNVAVGDAVIGDGLLTGPRSGTAYERQGGFASYAVAPGRALRPLPSGLSFDQGACLLAGYETAWHCLVARGRLSRGETVLIHGASGASGLAAVHIAKRVGATVIATGRSPDKLAIVAAQGADHVIAGANFHEQVKSLTGEGVDVVYDAVGGDVSIESLKCVKFGARFLVVGWASTPFVARGKGQRGSPNANVLPTNRILIKGLDVLGCPTAISSHRDPSIRVERLAAIERWVAEGLRPLVAATWPIEEAQDAMRAKWESRFVGNLIIRPG